MKLTELLETALSGTQYREDNAIARHSVQAVEALQTKPLTLAQELVADISDEHVRIYAKLNCEALLIDYMEQQRAAFHEFIFEREELDREAAEDDDEYLLGGP